MTHTPTDPGRVILWLLAAILVIVLVALILSVLDVHT
jgi:hypothetical protein